LQLSTGDGLDAQFLAGAAEGLAAGEVIKARWEVRDVEVALVEHDAAGRSCVRVEAHAEQQAARSRLLHVDEDVLEGAVYFRIDDGDRGANAGLGIVLEQ